MHAGPSGGLALARSKPRIPTTDDDLPNLAPPASEVTPTNEDRIHVLDLMARVPDDDGEDEETQVSERALPVAARVEPPPEAEDEDDDEGPEEDTTQHLRATQKLMRAPAPPSSEKPAKPVASWNVRHVPMKSDPLCGRTIASGKYRLESVIGEGAVGIVFKALHTKLRRSVAIKVLHPSYRNHPETLAVFEREARAASLLEHPHVARVYDYGEEPDGLVYIVMEYLSGYTLGNVLGARRKLPLARALDLVLQTCSALAVAHERGIVHRDVKPDNLVIVPEQDDEGRPIEIVKVCDFGIAALAPAAPKLSPDARNYIAGTPEYMAPEQALGNQVSPATDVYACGVVLYEMLTGRLPFTGQQPYQIVIGHLKNAPPPFGEPDVPPEIEAVVMRALEKKPEQRFANARELRVALRKAR